MRWRVSSARSGPGRGCGQRAGCGLRVRPGWAVGAARSSAHDGGWRAGAHGGGPTTRAVVGAVGVEVEGVVGTEVGGDVGAGSMGSRRQQRSERAREDRGRARGGGDDRRRAGWRRRPRCGGPSGVGATGEINQRWRARRRRSTTQGRRWGDEGFGHWHIYATPLYSRCQPPTGSKGPLLRVCVTNRE